MQRGEIDFNIRIVVCRFAVLDRIQLTLKWNLKKGVGRWNIKLEQRHAKAKRNQNKKSKLEEGWPLVLRNGHGLYLAL